MDPTAESQVSPVVTQKAEERKKIIDGQYKCFEKMNRDQPYNKSGVKTESLRRGFRLIHHKLLPQSAKSNCTVELALIVCVLVFRSIL